MTGTHTQNPIISRITLALMEDTGWYIANYSMAEPMLWGKGLGCDFVMKSCKEWMSMKSAKYEYSSCYCLMFLLVVAEVFPFILFVIKSNVTHYKQSARMIEHL